MLENEGHWLKLMRNAIVPTDANICLRISGGDIFCTVTKDVNKEVELKVTCRIGDQGNDEKLSDKEFSFNENHLNEFDNEIDSEDSSAANHKRMLNFPSEEMANLSETMTSKEQEKIAHDSSEDKIRSESNCDIETKPVKQELMIDGDPKDKTVKTSNSDDSITGDKRILLPSESGRKYSLDESGSFKCSLCNFYCTERRVFEKHLQSHRSSFKRSTSHVTNSQSFCDACNIQFMSVDTYQVHKKYYCKSRHDKEEPPSSPPIENVPVAISGAFKPSADTLILRSGAVNGTVAPSLIQPQAIYAAISTNPLILLPCSLVNGEGLVAQNSVLTTGGSGIILQTGVPCPPIIEKSPSILKVKEDITQSRKTSHPIMSFNPNLAEKSSSGSISLRKRKMSEGDVLNLKKFLTIDHEQEAKVKDLKPSANDQDAPLDLSLKRRKTSSISFSRTTVNRKNSSSLARECSSPIPSGDSCSSPRSTILPTCTLASSPSSTYSNDSIHGYSSHSTASLLKQPKPSSDRVSPSPPVLHSDISNDKIVLPPGMPPPKLLKQGNNICEECNIVFYKYDNYVAHKKHYCAFRRQQLSALAAAAAAISNSSSINNPEHSSDENSSNHSEINESSQGHSVDDSNKTVLRRNEPGEHFRPVISKSTHSTFVCDACGVKYSSLDTLNAHQTYYCSKRADSYMSKRKNRSEDDESQSAIEPLFCGPEEWKCNYCEATCSSYETIRRHLLTHNELKGFRCLLCGYKGNTLRGMRTHACEHINEKTTSIEEFVSSTVISETDALPIRHSPNECSDEESSQSRDHKSFSRREHTSSESCRRLSFKCEESVIGSQNDSRNMSPSMDDSTYKDDTKTETSSSKLETRDSSTEASSSSHQESVNPLAFCDVVIKTENEQSSSGDESLNEKVKVSVKSEPLGDSDSDSDGRELLLSESPPVQPISVIRRTSDRDRCSESFQNPQGSKRKSGTQTKTEMKYCKACDISFYHMSNFIAHKKYYCSRVVSNCHQETATVQ